MLCRNDPVFGEGDIGPEGSRSDGIALGMPEDEGHIGLIRDAIETLQNGGCGFWLGQTALALMTELTLPVSDTSVSSNPVLAKRNTNCERVRSAPPVITSMCRSKSPP